MPTLILTTTKEIVHEQMMCTFDTGEMKQTIRECVGFGRYVYLRHGILYMHACMLKH